MNPSWWWEEAPESLPEILSFINGSRRAEDPVGRCDALCKALNKTWNAYFLYRQRHGMLTDKEAEKGRSDAQAFTQLLLTGLPHEAREQFCLAPSLARLAQFTPQVMNHETLLRLKYDPFNNTDKVRKGACDEHQQLANSHQRFIAEPKDEGLRDALLKKTEQLLYVVRCNIAHSKKTPRGPDLEKAKRDREVSDVTSAVAEDFFELLFDRPSNRLAVYGTTLAPGEPNHAMLSGVGGSWLEWLVQGEVFERDGFRVFRWKLGPDKVSVKLLSASGLETHLPRIDRFEGPGYQRILVPVETDSGTKVSNIYAESVSERLT
jgi:gamma-glutamylcyclotransferase (GGCT)/AIG2-like uncharacterized protein YtfP